MVAEPPPPGGPAIGTSRPRRAVTTRLATALFVGAAAVSVLTEVRLALDTVTVTVIASPRGEAGREAARRDLDPRDDRAEIYGVPIGGPVDVVEPLGGPRGAWIAPPELSGRRLLDREALGRYARPAAVRLEGHSVAFGLAALGALLRFASGSRRTAATARTAPAAPSPPP